MSEGLEDIVQRSATTGVRRRPRKNERQVPKIGGGVFEFGKPSDADDRRDRLVASRNHEIGPLLGVGYEAGNASLGGLGHRHLTGLAQDGHGSTVQKSVEIFFAQPSAERTEPRRSGPRVSQLAVRAAPTGQGAADAAHPWRQATNADARTAGDLPGSVIDPLWRGSNTSSRAPSRSTSGTSHPDQADHAVRAVVAVPAGVF